MVLLFALISVALMAWQHWGMNLVMPIASENGNPGWVEDDRSENGNSIVQYQQNDAYHMQCEIRTAITYPFCNLFTALNPEDRGVDLTQYTTLHLDLSHQSSTRDSLRVYLNHFFAPEDQIWFPYKSNQQVINPREGRHSYTLKLDEFYVPPWWVYASDLPPKQTTPQLTNVRHLVLSTGDSSIPREVSLILHHAELRGKRISANALYRGLIWAWMLMALLYFSYRAIRYSREARTKHAETEQLRSLNRLLDLKSKRFEDLATHDPLTGLYNRAGLRPHLQEAVADYKRKQQPFSILMIDLDHFKPINDTYGHEEGDRILAAFARMVSDRCRQSDIPARWGGEEFVVVCKNSTAEAAGVLAEDLCRATREARLGEGYVVTCSIGVAQARGPDVGALFRSADEALYRAKNGGRDQVMTSS
ncbi:GGDEF domain-containing protein [Marinimicrobium sp. C6131]|uniref:GGDEF domain-containing protein n=1 Tax=Marinimicrobium sp. C6131 TaxID=3022676 RepID=UPI00223E8340|nr:GGDEF domain-containing protein [Marinimicrobium sp. C6131]UZJ45423.1 GGDEF domain-containing protein [Marinimicrobium sp. C6131]